MNINRGSEISKENKNIMMATHSEHILFRILTSVASGKMRPEDLAVYSFELKDGITKVKKLEVDKMGRLSGGLPDFFETNLDEFTRYLTALKE